MSQASSRVFMRYLLQSLQLYRGFSKNTGKLHKCSNGGIWLESSLILAQQKHSFSDHAGVEIAFEHNRRCSTLAVAYLHVRHICT